MSTKSVLFRWVLLINALSVSCWSLSELEADIKILLVPFICFCLKCSDRGPLHKLAGILGLFQVTNIINALLNYNNALAENIFYTILSKTPPRTTGSVILSNPISLEKPFINCKITPLHYLADNSLELIKCMILAGVVFSIAVGCHSLYSWAVIPKQIVPQAVLNDLTQVVHQNRLAIHDINAVIGSMHRDTASITDRSNFHNKVLEFNEIIINKNNAVLADISEISLLTPQIINAINRLQSHDDQIKSLQMQTASTIIMTHNHEMWLRSL